MSKRKGLSLDDKREKMLEIFTQSRDVFVIKDIEKLAVKKGIIAQSVKDVLQSLVDDDMVRQEKIGISNYYWSFPSEMSVKIEAELTKTQGELDQVKRQKLETQQQIVAAKKGKEGSDMRAAKMAEHRRLQGLIAEVDAQLTKYRENDPEAHKAMCGAVEIAKMAANRWTENIECMMSYCKRQFAGRDEELNNFFKENGAVDLEPL